MNFPVVYFKVPLQEILNVEQLGRSRLFFCFARHQTLEGFALTLAVPFVFLYLRSSTDVIHTCLTCIVRVAVREMYFRMADVGEAPVFSGSHHLRISLLGVHELAEDAQHVCASVRSFVSSPGDTAVERALIQGGVKVRFTG